MRSLVILSTLLVAALALADDVAKPYFGIRVVDEATGRGVPLVELRTVNEIVLHTDSGGWAAFHEPDMMSREVYFAVASPGYEFPADGFGNRGVRLITKFGESATIKLNRINLAERLYRVTGQGIWRDSELLGVTPKNLPQLNALTLGQDSVQAVSYRDRVFWLWGDTNLANYPLGNFHTTVATSPMPGEKFDPRLGVPLEYFVHPKQPDRVRAMAPSKEPGVVWLFGLLTIADPHGKEALIAHYSRQQGLGKPLEQGLMRFDDEAGVFQKIAPLDLAEKWRYPNGNAFRVKHGGEEFYYFAGPFAQTRVRADWKSLLDPQAYESLALDAESRGYRWQRDQPPTSQAEERKLIESGKLKREDARYQIVDAQSDKPVHNLHRSSIAWNPFRKKWILIGVQQAFANQPSFLGEIWYAEADDPAGPWRKAIKIASHPRYSFYNPRHHVFMDEQEGRFIYFEGTYTRTFSNNPVATPRYDYNQLMYRLDLADERLHAVR